MASPEQWRRSFVGSVPEAVATAKWIEGIAADRGVPGDVVFAVQLCSEELIANIVRHGGSASPRIEVGLGIFADRVELTVDDDGRPFDVAAAVPHRIEGPLEDVRPGGLGIHLIHSFSDALAFRREGMGNRIVATFKLPSATQPGGVAS
jgi:anti-sigma regulatory factor (Ser/Thr protein kinase)